MFQKIRFSSFSMLFLSLLTYFKDIWAAKKILRWSHLVYQPNSNKYTNTSVGIFEAVKFQQKFTVFENFYLITVFFVLLDQNEPPAADQARTSSHLSPKGSQGGKYSPSLSTSTKNSQKQLQFGEEKTLAAELAGMATIQGEGTRQ